MAAAAKQRKVDELVGKAGQTLSRKACFEAERMALKALTMARQEQDFDRMIASITPLREARMRRFQLAMQAGKVTSIEDPIVEDMKIKPGCYLVHPPQVGADARRLRLAALQDEIPVAVLCREPLTKMRLLPIVAISPGSTVRIKIPPPASLETPTLDWFAKTMVALGDWAIKAVEIEELPAIRKIDALLERLDAVPEHVGLHEALADACRLAAREQAAERAEKAARAKIKSP